MQGYYLGQLLIGALGVLFVSGEYSTGMIRSTFAAVPRRVPVLGIYLTMIGTIGMALGWIVRSTPGSLVAYIGLILVVPGIFATVLGTWGKDTAQFLPSIAGSAFITSLPETPSLAPWTGLGVLALWVIALLTVALVQLRRRDA